MTPLASNFLFVLGLMVVGAWLENIGGKDGWADRFFAPFPLGLSGFVFVFFERAWM